MSWTLSFLLRVSLLDWTYLRSLNKMMDNRPLCILMLKRHHYNFSWTTTIPLSAEFPWLLKPRRPRNLRGQLHIQRTLSKWKHALLRRCVAVHEATRIARAHEFSTLSSCYRTGVREPNAGSRHLYPLEQKVILYLLSLASLYLQVAASTCSYAFVRLR